MGSQSSPRTPPDPTDGCAKAPVLERLEEGEDQHGGGVGAGAGDLECFDRPLMKAAGDAEGEGGGEETYDPH